MNYGCININSYQESNIKINKMIDDRINNIVNNIEIPIINYENELSTVNRVISYYSIDERIRISKKYDNILEHFTEINNSVDMKYVKYLHKVCNKLIANLKIKLNIPRPFQTSYKYNKCIYPVSLISTHTPSLPSGHTALYYLYYLYFSKVDPQNKSEYEKIFNKGKESRIIAGVHYPIDNTYAIKAIDYIKDLLL